MSELANECPDCHGTGYLIKYAMGKLPERIDCKHCYGHGIVDKIGIKGYRQTELLLEHREQEIKDLKKEKEQLKRKIERLESKKWCIETHISDCKTEIGELEAEINEILNKPIKGVGVKIPKATPIQSSFDAKQTKEA